MFAERTKYADATLVPNSEIKDALNLLWRNEVPANQVNLGLGFYGRSYTLADPNCWQPGCVFKSPGHAGTCSVSISEIEPSGADDSVMLIMLNIPTSGDHRIHVIPGY